MTAEIVTHKNVKGVEKHYLKLKHGNAEHYMTISQLNVDAIKEMTKQEAAPNGVKGDSNNRTTKA
jgi:hypothetical protein